VDVLDISRVAVWHHDRVPLPVRADHDRPGLPGGPSRPAVTTASWRWASAWRTPRRNRTARSRSRRVPPLPLRA